jgi:hypothetical protein
MSETIMQPPVESLRLVPEHKFVLRTETGLLTRPSVHPNKVRNFVGPRGRGKVLVPHSFPVKVARLLCLGFAGALSLACGDGLGDATGSTCPESSTLTYANFGQAFVQSNCLSCHGSGGPETPTLATHDQVQAHIDDIDRAAAAGPNATNTFMPDGTSVSTEERRKLGEWLDCGAP